MSPPAAGSPHSRRTFALALVLCIVLVPLLQLGLGYLSLWRSSFLIWFFGTPIIYVLVGVVGAFCATGGLPASLAHSRGAQLALIGCLLGGFIAALILAAIVIQIFQTPPAPDETSRGRGLGLFLLIFFLVPAFLTVNLLGVGLASLGGLLGGTLRAHMRRGNQPTLALAGGQGLSRTWVVAIITMVVLAILIGLAGLWLTTGTFTAAR